MWAGTRKDCNECKPWLTATAAELKDFAKAELIDLDATWAVLYPKNVQGNLTFRRDVYKITGLKGDFLAEARKKLEGVAVKSAEDALAPDLWSTVVAARAAELALRDDTALDAAENKLKEATADAAAARVALDGLLGTDDCKSRVDEISHAGHVNQLAKARKAAAETHLKELRAQMAPATEQAIEAFDAAWTKFVADANKMHDDLKAGRRALT